MNSYDLSIDTHKLPWRLNSRILVSLLLTLRRSQHRDVNLEISRMANSKISKCQ